MVKNSEQPNKGELSEAISEVEFQQETEIKEIPMVERVDVALERQDTELTHREEKYDKKVLSGFKKWIGVATVMGASLLAVGCGTEKSSVETAKPHKTESGFTDNTQKNVHQRLENKKKEIKRMHENSRIVK